MAGRMSALLKLTVTTFKDLEFTLNISSSKFKLEWMENILLSNNETDMFWDSTFNACPLCFYFCICLARQMLYFSYLHIFNDNIYYTDLKHLMAQT